MVKKLTLLFSFLICSHHVFAATDQPAPKHEQKYSMPCGVRAKPSVDLSAVAADALRRQEEKSGERKEEKKEAFPGILMHDATLFHDKHLFHFHEKCRAYRGNAQVGHGEQKESKQPHFMEQFFDREILHFFMPFNRCWEHAQYDPDFGYYGSGNARFIINRDEKRQASGDFLTYPTIMPAFGAMIAYQIYAMWLSMLNSGDIKRGEKFYIVEFGAGEGFLSYDILSYIRQNAQNEAKYNTGTFWRDLFAVVVYVIGERSPQLRQRQKERNKEFIALQKLEIKAADARDAQIFKAMKIKGLVLSNELPDAFPVHHMVMGADGTDKVVVLCPAIKRDFLQAFIKQKFDSSKFGELLQKDRTYRNYFKRIFNFTFLDLRDDEVLLSQEDWCVLAKCAGKIQKNYIFKKRIHALAEGRRLPTVTLPNQFNENVRYMNVLVNAAAVPEIQSYLKRHAHYRKNILPKHPFMPDVSYAGRSWYLNYGVEGYVKSVSSFLDRGFVMTIDYGFNSTLHGLQLIKMNGVRLFPKNFNDMYRYMGWVDMTTDHNFTEQALVGSPDLDVVFYGCQDAMVGNKIRVSPHEIMAAYDLKNPLFGPVPSEEALRKFKDSNGFQMLIQSKVSESNCYRILAPSHELIPTRESVY